MTTFDRRMFLRGAAGATLALPFLPSLVRRARAGDPPRRPCFVALATDHGGIWSHHMFPGLGPADQTLDYRGHTIARRALSATTEGGATVLSPVLRADKGRLTPKLVGKMNVVAGLDHPFYIGHHSGGHLGNYARNDGNGGDGVKMQGFPNPTVDQIMAWSPAFYAPTDPFKTRSLIIGGGVSYGWSDTATQSGKVEALPPQFSSKQLFSSIYTPPKDDKPTRGPVVDRVLENYKRLRTSNRRLSADDRLRLDAHLAKVDELERKLKVLAPAACVQVEPAESNQLPNESDFPYNPDKQKQFWQLINQVIATALSCGTSRIAVLKISQTFSTYQGDWHQSIAHQSNAIDGVAQGTLYQGLRSTFEDVFVDLAHTLDETDAGGGFSVLDDTLLQWTQESGNLTHDANSIPLITAGSAAGRLATGLFVDYRHPDKLYGQWPNQDAPEGQVQHSGLLYNQWLGNVLDVMGVSRQQWQGQSDSGGYGKLLIGEGYTKSYDDKVHTSMNDPLPWLVKA